MKRLRVMCFGVSFEKRTELQRMLKTVEDMFDEGIFSCELYHPSATSYVLGMLSPDSRPFDLIYFEKDEFVSESEVRSCIIEVSNRIVCSAHTTLVALAPGLRDLSGLFRHSLIMPASRAELCKIFTTDRQTQTA